jgi:two-component system chemotaxis response regulator CheY
MRGFPALPAVSGRSCHPAAGAAGRSPLAADRGAGTPGACGSGTLALPNCQPALASRKAWPGQPRRVPFIEPLPMAVDPATRVLVAEDNPNLRKVIVNIVRKIGYQDIVEVDDGIQAWTEIEKGTVGLLLTDWAMPGMNGLELLKRVRGAKDPIKNLPILMITAADTKDSILTAGKEGVDAYIIKPFSVKTIMDKIQEAVDHRAKL